MRTLDSLAHFDIAELKLVYRVLHRHLLEHTELMDTDFFTDLQRWLQTVAGRQGVDVSDHSQWDAWLQGRTPDTPHKVIPFPRSDT